MDQSEKLLMGIEHILSVASDLVDEIARLKRVEEECKILKEKVFLNQFTVAEQQVFELALDGYSGREMQVILSKEEATIKSQRKNIIRKLGVSSMKEAVEKFQHLEYESPRKLLQFR
ncbi:LuxR C-terminal-related transcriptional regulator [Priestia aryabhattai]|uniref:LuxR C-terminal-related transcriptional regulator n=1 Tax=Priestia aryabhattai TaxID=412384 RepID=UPI000BF08009|nr:LuxR C-terminal-related transcriptional regulator [Priestia aryabhattai]PEI51119.1 LuxR family transcriptional regulator [Priestia aryabhattai]